MRKLTFEECKKIELDILLDVAKFCDDNGLEYFMAYGTLIGAIRHKGFIPWDDDIDIYMPRKDYNKFIELFKGEGKPERLEAIHPKHPMSRHPFMKVIDTRTAKYEKGYSYPDGVLGIDIDVFPLDGQPDDEEEFNKWYDKLYKLYLLDYLSNRNGEGSLKRRMAHIGIKILNLFMPLKKIRKKTAALHEKYPYESSKYVGSVECIASYKNDRMPKELFEGYSWCEFEGHKFKAPKGYHEVLTALYGDYMQLPPEEQRVNPHLTEAFMKD